MKLIRNLLPISEYTRPGTYLESVRGVVLHWPENAGQTARGIYNYFLASSNGENGYGSAPAAVDFNGDILWMIPFNEIAHHAGPTSQTTPRARKRLGGYPNGCTIGIEICHTDWAGTMTPETVDGLRNLLAFLCIMCRLDPFTDIYTHYQITGKVTARGPCPKWYVEHPTDLDALQHEVAVILDHPGRYKG